jgi:putative nucleotidyltransferase with HDIG domain
MDKVDQYIESVTQLPPAPTLLIELLGLFKEPDRDVDRVVELVSLEPSITAEVLKRCNSAFLGGGEPASDMFEAVSRLGFYEVYTVVAAMFGASAKAIPGAADAVDVSQLWKHSVITAVAASIVAEEIGEVAGPAFTSGLLHDIGKLIFASVERGQYGDLLKATNVGNASLIAAERNAYGTDHAEIGGRLLAKWNLPPEVASAIQFHHTPTADAADPYQRPAATVCLGDWIAHHLNEPQPVLTPEHNRLLGALEIQPANLKPMIDRTQKGLERVKGLLDM